MNLSPRGATTHYHRLVDLQRNEVLTVPPKAGNPTSGYHTLVSGKGLFLVCR